MAVNLIRRWSLTIQNRQVTLFLAYNALLHIGMLGISDAILNFYFVSLGHGSETIGALQSLPRVGGILASLPVGLLANRIGARRVIIWSTGGIFATYVMLIAWPDLIALGLSRFLLGWFWGAAQVATTPFLMSLLTREHETRIFAYLNVVSMGATAVGSLVGGYLPLWAATLFPTAAEGLRAEQSIFAYRAALAVAGLTIGLSALPLLGLADQDMLPGRRGQPLLRNIPWRWLTWLSLPLLIFGFTGGLTFPFYNLFFRAMFDAPDKAVGRILSLGWIGMALIPLASPWWERRFGRAWALFITLSIAASAFLGLSIAPTLAVSIVCYVVATSFRNMMQTLFQPLIMDALPSEQRNIASSIGMVLWSVGWFSATAISGFWQATFGFGVIMRLVAGGVLLNGIVVVGIFRRISAQQQREGI